MGSFSLFSAPGGPHWASGAPKSDSGRETSPGEGVQTSGRRRCQKTRRRGLGFKCFELGVFAQTGLTGP
eukprot:4770742-Pyramimonas_sp.AAC.1